MAGPYNPFAPHDEFRDGVLPADVEAATNVMQNPRVSPPIVGTDGIMDVGRKLIGSYPGEEKLASPTDPTIPAMVTGGGDSSDEASENEDIMHEADIMSRLAGGNRGPGAYFQQEGESYAGVRGPGLYEETFRGAPGRRKEAMSELGDIQAARATEMAGMYDRQVVQDQAAARAMAVSRQQEQEQLALKQEELTKATRYHTRELSDSGKFWANPGNIIAAISYSLMPIFSNDPTVGVKLINQAIQQDMDNRQKAADTSLGAMRGNLDGYRKLAGDRQQGDILARAEAHRMAAQEIHRIGSKFAGPESQKQMQIALADQETRAAAAEMEFYAKYVHKDVKKTLPGETQAMYRGPGGYHPLGTPDGSAADKPASPVNGTVGGGPSQVSNKGFKSPVIGALARAGGAGAVDRHLEKAEVTGKTYSPKDIENVAMMLVRQQAQAEHPNDPGGPLKVYKKEMDKIEPVALDLQKSAETRQRIARVRGTMDIIERGELLDGRDPNEFLSWAKTAMPASWVLEYEKFTAKNPEFAKNGAEKRAIIREERTKALRAELQGIFNQHNHELFGGAQTEKGSGGGEIGRGMQEVGNKSSWYGTRNFLDNRSQELQAAATARKASLTPMGKVMLRIRTHKNGTDNTFLPRKDVPK